MSEVEAREQKTEFQQNTTKKIDDPQLQVLYEKMSGMELEEIVKNYKSLMDKYFEQTKSLDTKDRNHKRELLEQKKSILKDVFGVFKDVVLLSFDENNINSFIRAVKIIKKKIETNIFEKYNIHVIQPEEYSDYDEKYHEAVGTVVTNEQELVNKIASVIEIGFSIGDEVVTPSKVLVYIHKEQGGND